MSKQSAQNVAMLDAMDEYGRNYNLPVTYEDTGETIVAHYPAREASLTSGGWWQTGRPALAVPYPY